MLLVQSSTLPGSPARQGWFTPWRYLASLARLGLLGLHLSLPKELILLAWTDLGVVNLLLSLCTVWATDLGFVALTEAPRLGTNVLPGVIGVGPNKCMGRGVEVAGPLRSSFLLH